MSVSAISSFPGVNNNLKSNSKQTVSKNNNNKAPSFKMVVSPDALSSISDVAIATMIGVGTLLAIGFTAIMLFLRHIGRHWR